MQLIYPFHVLCISHNYVIMHPALTWGVKWAGLSWTASGWEGPQCRAYTTRPSPLLGPARRPPISPAPPPRSADSSASVPTAPPHSSAVVSAESVGLALPLPPHQAALRPPVVVALSGPNLLHRLRWTRSTLRGRLCVVCPPPPPPPISQQSLCIPMCMHGVYRKWALLP